VLRLEQANNPLARREPGNTVGMKQNQLVSLSTRVSGSALILCGSGSSCGSRVLDDQKSLNIYSLKNVYFLIKKLSFTYP
jgi:hypothetical protein